MSTTLRRNWLIFSSHLASSTPRRTFTLFLRGKWWAPIWCSKPLSSPDWLLPQLAVNSPLLIIIIFLNAFFCCFWILLTLFLSLKGFVEMPDVESVLGLMNSSRNEGIVFKQSRLCFGIVASNVAVTPVRICLPACLSVNVIASVCIIMLLWRCVLCSSLEFTHSWWGWWRR